MPRKLNNWLEGYLEYTSGTEAPRIMHKWAGVSTIAGALRRKVWIDQIRFCWYPSFYIVFVSDPGIATKSTTADLAMELLTAVPGIHFGPDSVTWQSLVVSFMAAGEAFDYQGAQWPMSALTLVSSEFGLLMDLSNKEMVNLFITLWDGRKKFEKQTKMSGNEIVEAPWINMLACTTPSWIASNMDTIATAGGLTSRTIYVFAEGKENYIPYLDEQMPKDLQGLKANLMHDLEHISLKLAGPFKITEEAREWGRLWYEILWKEEYTELLPDWHKGYISRKQTHLHKLAMVLSVARGDDMIITLEDLTHANAMLAELEPNLHKVFAQVGMSETSRHVAKLIDICRIKGLVTYPEVYRYVHKHFPNGREFAEIIDGVTRAGYVEMQLIGNGLFNLKWIG